MITFPDHSNAKNKIAEIDLETAELFQFKSGGDEGRRITAIGNLLIL